METWIIKVLSTFGPTFVYDHVQAGRDSSRIKTFANRAEAEAFAAKHWPADECTTDVVEL